MKCPSCYEPIPDGQGYCDCGWRDPASSKATGPLRLTSCHFGTCAKVGKYPAADGFRYCAEHYPRVERQAIAHGERSRPPGGFEALKAILEHTVVPMREPGEEG